MSSIDTNQFNDVIESYGLYQFVQQSTHKSGHILDVDIASHNIINENSVNVLNDYSSEFPTCDHYIILFCLNCSVELNNNKKVIKFRNFKNIDYDQLKMDLVSTINSFEKQINFENSISTFNNACISVLNSHAPVLENTIRDIQSSQWFDSNYKAIRARRRKAEKVWNKSGNKSD